MLRSTFIAIFCCTVFLLLSFSTISTVEEPNPLGMTLTPPGVEAIALRPPTAEEQLEQLPNINNCGPVVAATLYNVLVGKPYPLEGVSKEIMISENGASCVELTKWFTSKGLDTALVHVPIDDLRNSIVWAVKSGYYIVPSVYEDANPVQPHFFIIYGVDGDRVLISDSKRRRGQHTAGIDGPMFGKHWVIDVGERNGRHYTPFVLVRLKNQEHP